jgi:hypothetical protein
MEQGQLNWVANFIWGIADDVLRDLYVRGKFEFVFGRRVRRMGGRRRGQAVSDLIAQTVSGLLVIDAKASGAPI